jgi:polyisoprenoid-binding protein YceI
LKQADGAVAPRMLYMTGEPNQPKQGTHLSGEQAMVTEHWEIDSSHSSIHFAVRHLVIATVRGHFTRWSATLVAPDGDFTRASLEATIDASSIDTGVADRDAHLKSPDFLDVAQYPEIRFTTSRVEKDGNDLRLAGS